MPKLIVTAQRLADGRVVYLRPDRSWTQRDSEAWITDDASALEAELAWAKTQTEVVVEPYRIEVELEPDGTVRHLSARERIRAGGPASVLARFAPGRRELLRVAAG
ncbi:MAG TPA: DUF2849 domain-containing protein [Sandaracinaceae bacterium]